MHVRIQTDKDKPPSLVDFTKAHSKDAFRKQGAKKIGHGETDFLLNKAGVIARCSAKTEY